jgi:hypothetical protein
MSENLFASNELGPFSAFDNTTVRAQPSAVPIPLPRPLEAGAAPPPAGLPSAPVDLGALRGAVGMYAEGDVPLSGLRPSLVPGGQPQPEPAGQTPGQNPALPALPTVHALPPDFVGPPSRENLIQAQREKLEQGSQVVPTLPESQRDAYIRELLKDTARFSAQLHGQGEETDKNTNLPPRHAVPPSLISTVRPLINQIEKPGEGRTAAGDSEAARDGTTTDWNSQLGVPQYRTQSDNLMTPEGSCNLTTLAMALERLGYNRADALRAVERKLKRDELKRQNEGKAVCVMDSDEDLDKMKMPDGLFERTVQGYLRNQMNPEVNGAAYQRLRGENAVNEDEIRRLSQQYRQNAQFEDMLDLLRHVATPNQGRTSMSQGVPETILRALEPDPERRPRLQTLQPGATTWDGVRTAMSTSLEKGGAGFVSFRHKGAGSDATHIISAQNVEEGGTRFDDPYGTINPEYRRNRTGDAYAPTGSRTRTAEFKNQVYGNNNRGDGVVGNDWKAEAGQALQPGESLGDSNFVPNAVHQNSWMYARTMTPRTREEIAAADAARYQQVGVLRLPRQGLRAPGATR